MSSSYDDSGSQSRPEELKSTDREKVEDSFITDKNDCKNKLLLRCTAKGLKFKGLTFSYTIFEHCYFRNCEFENCEFTGCKFLNSNFRGTKFVGCKFEYAYFDKSYLEESIFNCAPSWENVKLHFARSLRINFQSLGDANLANKAILMELDATEIHLKKSWSSNSTYYHAARRNFFHHCDLWRKWLIFKIMDLLWGNGESAIKLLRTAIFTILLMACVHLIIMKENTFRDLWRAIGYSPQIFIGTERPDAYPGWYLTIITTGRLIIFGFFMAILVKRFNRR